MQGSERAKSFVHLISFTVLSALLIMCGTFLPVIGFAFMLAASTPLALLGCIDGAAFLSAGIFLLESILFIAFSPLLALYAALGCVPLAITIYFISLNYNLKNQYALKLSDSGRFTGSSALLLCASAAIISKLALLVIFRFLTGRNILIPDAAQLEVFLGQFGSGADVNELRRAIMQSIAIMPYILPSILIIYSSFEAVINYALCLKFLNRNTPQSPTATAPLKGRQVLASLLGEVAEDRKGKTALPPLPPFKDWAFPVSILPVLIFTFIMGFFIDSDKWFEGAVFIMNLRLILNALFLVQGMAFAFWFMNYKNFRRTSRFILTVFMIFPLMWLWLILLGVSDMAFNFRGRLKENKK